MDDLFRESISKREAVITSVITQLAGIDETADSRGTLAKEFDQDIQDVLGYALSTIGEIRSGLPPSSSESKTAYMLSFVRKQYVEVIQKLNQSYSSQVSLLEQEHEQETARARSRVAELESLFSQNESEIKRLMKAATSADVKANRTEMEHKKAINELKATMSQLSLSENECERLRNELRQLEDSKKEVEDDRDMKATTIETLEANIEVLEEQLQESKRRNNVLSLDQDASQRVSHELIKQLEADKRLLKEEIERLNVGLLDRDKETAQLKSELEAHLEQIRLKEKELDGYRDKISMSRDEVEQLNNKMVKLERISDENETNKQTINNKQRQVEELEELLRAHKRDIASLNEQLRDKDGELVEIGRHSEELLEELKISKFGLLELRGKVKALDEALEGMKKATNDETQRFVYRCTSLEEQLKGKDVELANLRQEMANLASSMSETSACASSKDAIIMELRNSIRIKEEMLRSCRLDDEQIIKELDAKVEMLGAKLQKADEDMGMFVDVINNKTETINSQEQRLELLSKTVEERERRISEMQAHWDTLNSNYKASVFEASTLSEKVAQLQETVTSHEGTIGSLYSAMGDRDREIDRLNQLLIKVQDEYDKSVASSGDANNTMKQLRDLLDAQREEQERMKDHERELKAIIDKRDHTILEHIQQVESARKEAERVEKEHKLELMTLNDLVGEKGREYERLADELEGTKGLLRKATERVALLTGEMQRGSRKQQEQLEEQLDKLDRLGIERDKLRRELESHNEVATTATKRIEALERTIKGLEGKIGEAERGKSDMSLLTDVLREKVVQLTGEKEEQEQKIEALKADISGLLDTKAELERQLEQEGRRVLRLMEEKEQQIKEMDKDKGAELKNLENQLRNAESKCVMLTEKLESAGVSVRRTMERLGHLVVQGEEATSPSEDNTKGDSYTVPTDEQHGQMSSKTHVSGTFPDAHRAEVPVGELELVVSQVEASREADATKLKQIQEMLSSLTDQHNTQKEQARSAGERLMMQNCEVEQMHNIANTRETERNLLQRRIEHLNTKLLDQAVDKGRIEMLEREVTMLAEENERVRRGLRKYKGELRLREEMYNSHFGKTVKIKGMYDNPIPSVSSLGGLGSSTADGVGGHSSCSSAVGGNERQLKQLKGGKQLRGSGVTLSSLSSRSDVLVGHSLSDTELKVLSVSGQAMGSSAPAGLALSSSASMAASTHDLPPITNPLTTSINSDSSSTSFGASGGTPLVLMSHQTQSQLGVPPQTRLTGSQEHVRKSLPPLAINDPLIPSGRLPSASRRVSTSLSPLGSGLGHGNRKTPSSLGTSTGHGIYVNNQSTTDTTLFGIIGPKVGTPGTQRCRSSSGVRR